MLGLRSMPRRGAVVLDCVSRGGPWPGNLKSEGTGKKGLMPADVQVGRVRQSPASNEESKAN